MLRCVVVLTAAMLAGPAAADVQISNRMVCSDATVVFDSLKNGSLGKITELASVLIAAFEDMDDASEAAGAPRYFEGLGETAKYNVLFEHVAATCKKNQFATLKRASRLVYDAVFLKKTVKGKQEGQR